MKNILVLLAVLWHLTGYSQLKNSPPVELKWKNNVVIKNLKITNPKGSGILLENCSNITIENCVIYDTKESGVDGYAVTGITIRNCEFVNNRSGIYLISSKGVVIENNKCKNVQGPFPRGQFAQLNRCTGPGMRISCNYVINEQGKSNPEDVINIYHTYGDENSPLIIEDNYIKGGGPSTSGGGILCADQGAGYVICRRNVLVNPGQYGVGVASGHHIELSDNKIYSDKLPWTNVGITVWDPYELKNCQFITVKNNQVFWLNKKGEKNPIWINDDKTKSCTNVVDEGNELEVKTLNDSIPPPDCVKNRF